MNYDAKIKYPKIDIELEFDGSPTDAEVEQAAWDEFKKTTYNIGALIDIKRLNYNHFMVTFEYSGRYL